MSSEARPSSPRTSSPVARRVPPQRQQDTRSPSTGTLPRRVSTQDRINEILETGRGRADTMRTGSWSSGRSPPYQPLARPAENGEDGGPDERTGIIMRGSAGNGGGGGGGGGERDYQATSVTKPSSSPLASRGSPARHAAAADGVGDDGDNDGGLEEKHGWKDLFQGIWSTELENKGSVARDHLALERTFLAWLRTSLAFASIGIAITQLFRLNTSLSDGSDNSSFRSLRHAGKPLGATFLGISILVLFLGYQRYFQIQKWLVNGKFPASRGSVVLISIIAFAIMVVSLVVVVVIQPSGQSDS